MSHVESAEYTLENNSEYHYSDSDRLVRATEAQTHATLALVEAQETANLIAFLDWVDQSFQYVSHAEYMGVIKQVKERLK